jgi:hypothetical protein
MATGKVKNMTAKQSDSVGFRSHVKSPRHSEMGEANSPHEKGELNQVKGNVAVQNNKTVKYR